MKTNTWNLVCVSTLMAWAGFCMIAGAAEVRPITLEEKKSDIINVPGVARILAMDEVIASAKSTGSAGEVMITANKFGEADVKCFDDKSNETILRVTVRPRFWKELAEILKPYPQIENKVSGEKIILRGAVMNKSEKLAVQKACELDPRITCLVAIDKAGLKGLLEDKLKKDGYADDNIRVLVEGDTARLEGEIVDQARLDRIKSMMTAFLKEYEMVPDFSALVFKEKNMVVNVKFIKLSKSKFRDVGLKLEDIGLSGNGATAGGSGTPWAWTADAAAKASGAIKMSMENGASKVAYETTLSTKSGKEAVFQEGGTAYLKLVTANQMGSTPIDYGFLVKTTPKLTSPTSIEATVDVDISVPVTQKAGADYEIKRYKTNSSNTLKPGESMILSGLGKTLEDLKKTGTPLLSSLPVLGSLFSSKTASNEDEEDLLVITVDYAKQNQGADTKATEMQKRELEVKRPGSL